MSWSNSCLKEKVKMSLPATQSGHVVCVVYPYKDKAEIWQLGTVSICFHVSITDEIEQ